MARDVLVKRSMPVRLQACEQAVVGSQESQRERKSHTKQLCISCLVWMLLWIWPRPLGDLILACSCFFLHARVCFRLQGACMRLHSDRSQVTSQLAARWIC